MKFEDFLEKNIHPEYKYYYIDYTGLRNRLKKEFNEEEENAFVGELEEEMNRVFNFINLKHDEFSKRISLINRDIKGTEIYSNSNVSSKSRNRTESSLHGIGCNISTGNGSSLVSKSKDSIRNSKCSVDSNTDMNSVSRNSISRTSGSINISSRSSVNTDCNSKESAPRINDSKSNESVNVTIKGEISKVQDEMKIFADYITINIVGFKKILKKHDKFTNYNILPFYMPKLKSKIRSMKNLDALLYKVSKTILSHSYVNLEKNSLSTSSFVRNTSKYWVHRDNILSLKCFVLRYLPIYVFSNENNEESPFASWNEKTHDRCISSVYFDNRWFSLYEGRLRKLPGAEAIRIRWYTSKIGKLVFIERKRHEDGWTGVQSKKERFKMPEKYVDDYINGHDVWKHCKSYNKDNKREALQLYKEIQEKIVKEKLRPVVRTFYKRTAFQLPNSAQVRISLDTELCMIRECTENDLKNDVRPLVWRRKDVECEYPFTKLKKEDIVRFPYAILEIKLQSVDETKPDWVNELISSSLVEHVHKFSKFLHGAAVLFQNISDIPYWLPQMDVNICRKEFLVTPMNKEIVIDIPENEEIPLISDSSKAGLMTVDTRNKRIALPVRIEPKVFFANERTFLSWLHFSIFIGGIGTALMGLGDSKAVYSGIAFICVSVLFAIYALYLYFWRASMIRLRDPGPYDDLYGPFILVVVFLIAMVLSIFFKFPLLKH
ncbi:vacuolar transporter chaperone 4 [Hamiltosporidium tvaerminnensis]|uniref:Vacuolar transporter chaperone 4 n=1 Tax=Hamiltosporidium tvaerminnensis TaxID=1176355 RepID=A0A4Q9LAX5_9MICR|nr:hypothetical protein LUQ84_003207 [Hamiltosporidium tvaerminnensis]TBU04475.1 vacuolar transporter chaperone 4 [Hamiltosporidium tvaerminnensis]